MKSIVLFLSLLIITVFTPAVTISNPAGSITSGIQKPKPPPKPKKAPKPPKVKEPKKPKAPKHPKGPKAPPKPPWAK
jgi:hypothetical protein